MGQCRPGYRSRRSRDPVRGNVAPQGKPAPKNARGVILPVSACYFCQASLNFELRGLKSRLQCSVSGEAAIWLHAASGFESRMEFLMGLLLSLGVASALTGSTPAQIQGKGGGHTAPPPATGTWVRTPNIPANDLGVPLLLTDGTVICHVPQSRSWRKLTPDAFGSYQNGTWSNIAQLPSGYGPLYYASAVLADGRVVVIGGEYNTGQS